tara:strand:+ start:84 stop:263 length:180 start_codon:yes stop_codon:yes gene_type:complete
MIIFIFIFLVGGGWFIGKLLAFSITENNIEAKEPDTIINNHVTNNHLHVSDEQFKKIKS